jgi:glutamine cyclotransferase
MLKNVHYRIMLLFSFCLISCGNKQQTETRPDFESIKKVKPVILKVIPHDTTAFTQGLLFHDGKLYESTGLYGKSTIRIVDTNGSILQSKPLPPEVFAEGCALFGGLMYQITWKEQVCVTYNMPELQPSGTLEYEGEGWGLTSDNSYLYMSSGTNVITVRDKALKILKSIPVTMAGKPLININEMELVGDKLYANVWFSDFIFEINLSTAAVTRIIDCSEIVTKEASSDEQNVLNGIAFDGKGQFYITGKNWKNMFVVKIQ